jgi:hypothetical protein
MGESGRKTVLVRFRALPGEAASLRARAAEQGCTLSELLLRLAADAGWIAERSTYGAPARGAPEHPFTAAARIEALEARVAALEARQGSGVASRRERPVARRSAPENRQQRQPTTRRYADDDPKRAVRPSDLPSGFPATGAELGEWRRRSGLSGRAFAEAAGGLTRQAVDHQAKKGDRPLSLGFALGLVEAVEAGRLPAP